MTKIMKPWGWELWFARSRHYVGKFLYIKKGHRLSKQYHRYKHETVYSMSHHWRLELSRSQRNMKPGESVSIRPGMIHRFCAPYGNVLLIEVSTPQVNDVVRLEDDYQRLDKKGSRPPKKKIKKR